MLFRLIIYECSKFGQQVIEKYLLVHIIKIYDELKLKY